MPHMAIHIMGDMDIPGTQPPMRMRTNRAIGTMGVVTKLGRPVHKFSTLTDPSSPRRLPLALHRRGNSSRKWAKSEKEVT